MLAVAARPTLGQAGFVLIGIAALLSTASAINATLFGAARLAMVMASERALPRLFSRRERGGAVPYAALLALTGASAAFTLLAPLPLISSFASATFLLIFAGVNVSAFRLARRIGMARWIPLLGAVLAAASLIVLFVHLAATDRTSLWVVLTVYLIAAVAETGLALRRGPRPSKET